MGEEIEFGSLVRDTWTGFIGRLVARNEWWDGKASFGVEPIQLKDGRIQETQWIDTRRIVPHEEELSADAG